MSRFAFKMTQGLAVMCVLRDPTPLSVLPATYGEYGADRNEAWCP